MFELFDIIYYFILLLILVMGITVLINNHKSKNNWIFFLFILGTIGWMISLRLGWGYVDYSNWEYVLFWMRSAYGFSILGMSLMTIFIYLFPRPTFVFPKTIRIIYLSFTAILFLLASFTPLINESLVIVDGIYTKDAFGLLYPFYVFDIILNFGVSAYFSISKLKNTYGLEKEKMTFVALGYLIFVILAILTNVILPLFNIFILQRESQILIVAFIVPAFYAIYRYRFFNFSNVSLNTLKGLVSYVIFLLSAFLTYELIVHYYPDIDRIFLGLFSAFTALIVFQLAKKKLPDLVTESFREFQNALREFKTKIYFCDTYENLQMFIDRTFLIQLNYINAKIYVVRKNKDEFIFPSYIKNKFTEKLKKYKRDVLVRDEIQFQKIKTGTKDYLLLSMDKLEADLCIPLFSEGNLIGFLVLRKKESDLPYSNEEIKEFLKMKRDLEIGLMNILIKMNLEEENNLMKAIIDKKTKDLREKMKQIKELLRQQSDFIAVTAHEFRTPLSIALFQLEEMSRTTSSETSPAKLRKDLQVIDESLDNLKVLTQKLFAVQQYDLNKVKLNEEKTDIKKFIRELYKDFLGLMKEKRLDFILEDNLKSSVFIDIDKSQIRQVMHNVLTNAYKFCTEKGKVKLGLSQHGKYVSICISDDGKGIPDGLKKTIFNKFRTNSAGSGIGLGLYICKKIIELHKGKIWAEDSEWGGAKICIQLNK